MTSLSSMLGGIKSVQRGVFAGSPNMNPVTINISPVNPAKAFVNVNSTFSPANLEYEGRISLSSSTTLAAASAFGGAAHPLYWEVIEFY